MRTYKDPYMNFVMTPPRQELPKYEMYQSQVGDMEIINDNARPNISRQSLGELPANVFGEFHSWMPIVLIVVSAMALITLYAVVTKR